MSFQIAANFQIGDQKFRGWMKTEFGNQEIFYGKLFGKTWTWKNPLEPEERIRRIFKINNLEDDFQDFQYTKFDLGINVSFEVKKEISDVIKQRGNVLKAGVVKFKLQCKF